MDCNQMSLLSNEIPAEEQLRTAVQNCVSDKEHKAKYIETVQNKNYISVKSKNLVAVKIETKKSGIRIEFKSKHDDLFSAYSIEHSDNGTSRINLKSFDEVIGLASAFATMAERDLVLASDSFGCCSRYEACSDAKRCIHPDQEFSSACAYRKNLEEGRIFYGKNKNK